MGTVKTFITRNASNILKWTAIGGVVTTSYLAITAAVKAKEVCDEYQRRYEELSPKEKLKMCWHFFIPVFFSAGATIACIVTSMTIDTREKRQLSTLYLKSRDMLQEYQRAALEKLGEKKEAELKDKLAKDKLETIQSSQVITMNGDCLFLDSFTGRLFASTMEKVKSAINEGNANIIRTGWYALGDFYYELGLPSTDIGELVGWDSDNLIDVNFSTQLTEDNRPCIVMRHNCTPVPCVF